MVDMGIGVPMTPAEALEMLKALKDKPDNTVEGHYGFTKKDIDLMIGDMIRDLYVDDIITDTIDRHFKKMDAETRLKVFAFALAYLKARHGSEKA